MFDFLDDIPLASILTVIAAVLVFVAYLANDISAFEALAAFGISAGGAGALGYSRAASGKGVKKEVPPV